MAMTGSAVDPLDHTDPDSPLPPPFRTRDGLAGEAIGETVDGRARRRLVGLGTDGRVLSGLCRGRGWPAGDHSRAADRPADTNERHADLDAVLVHHPS